MPGFPENISERKKDARTADLEGTGFVAYDVPGLPFTSDTDPKSGSAFPVYIWLYGPPDFSKEQLTGTVREYLSSATLSPTKVRPGEKTVLRIEFDKPVTRVKNVLVSSSDSVIRFGSQNIVVPVGQSSATVDVFTSSSQVSTKVLITVRDTSPFADDPLNVTLLIDDSSFPWWLLLLLAVGIGTGVFLRPLPVSVRSGNKEVYGARVRRGGRVPILGPGMAQANSFVLTDDLALGAPNKHLATIEIPFFGTPFVKGELFSVEGAGVKGGVMPLDKARPFRLKSRSDGVCTSSLTAKIG
jgi:hypothetical protein